MAAFEGSASPSRRCNVPERRGVPLQRPGLQLLGLVVAMLLTVAVAGCSTACPAIGWINSVSFHLNGNVRDVAVLELCADGECATSAPLPQGSQESLHVLTPEELAAVSSQRPAGPSLFSISRVDERNWRASVAMTTPETVTVRALSSTGQVLAEREVALEWRRVGGTERCGGPGEAGSVDLDIPS